jgi:hypothetical protein
MSRTPVHSVALNSLGSPSTPDSSKRGHGRDFYFSHNWEEDEIGRNNHRRVETLAKYMASAAFTTWFDGFDLGPGGGANQAALRQEICKGIDDSTVIVVCLTRKYLRKVRDGSDLGQDNCQFEFNYATNRVIPKVRLVALVMEPYCLQLANWSGPVLGVMADKLFLDFTDDEKLHSVAEALCNSLWSLVKSGMRKDGSAIPRALAERKPSSPPRGHLTRVTCTVGDLINVKFTDGRLAAGRICLDVSGSVVVELADLTRRVENEGFRVGDYISQLDFSGMDFRNARSEVINQDAYIEVTLDQDARPMLQSLSASVGHRASSFRLQELVAVTRSNGRVTFAHVLQVNHPQDGWLTVRTKSGASLVQKEVPCDVVWKIFGRLKIVG